MPRSPTKRHFDLAMMLSSIVLVGVGCEEPPTLPDLEEVASLVVVSGAGQFTLPNGQVPRPLVVRAIDASGRARPGVDVRWAGSGDSRFDSDITVTDGAGLAAGVWELGTDRVLYEATARADDYTEARFAAATEGSALVLSAVPESLVFRSLSDTATIRVRVRSAKTGLDTLFDPTSLSGPSESVARHVFVGRPHRLVLQSVRNGSAFLLMYYGRVPVPIRIVVRQVPVGMRIVPSGSTVPVTDTLMAGPDSSLALAVSSVDARGRVVEDSSALAGVRWNTTDVNVATVDDAGIVRTRQDGVVTLIAAVAASEVRASLRVWTMAVSAVDAGGSSTTCALLTDGGVACWGFRTIGANSEVDLALAPERRLNGPFTALSISDGSACVLTAGGVASGWGSNELGQLGRGSIGTYGSTPMVLSGGLTFASLGAGPVRSCGLTTDGRAYCWGLGVGGMLGDGTYGTTTCEGGECTPRPTPVVGGHTFIQLAVGASHTCGLTADGRAWCWGLNWYGQLGSARAPCAGYVGADAVTSGYLCSTVPVQVEGALRFRSLSAGNSHTCGITTDGALYCWGTNLNGVLGADGIPEGVGANPSPVPVATTRRFLAVEANEQSHTCAIDTERKAWCWGLPGALGSDAPATGQCLNGPCHRVPVPVAGALTFRSLSTGGAHTCGLTTQGVVYCWGWGGSGATGTGTTANAPRPVPVAFQRFPNE